jgi:ribose transport system substrate-binding protein
MRRTFFSFACLGLLLALGPGCTTNPTKPGSGPAAAKAARPRVAFVSNNAEDFWTIAQKGTLKAEKDFDADVEFKMPADGSAEAQRQIIEDLLNKGIQGIAVSANDAKNSVGFFKNQVAKKVPLIMQDNEVPDPSARRCYIGTNNYVAGRAVGELIAKAVPKGGKIAIFVGRMDAQNAIERRQGVLDYLMNPKSEQKELDAITLADAADMPLGDKYILVGTKTDLNKAEDCQNYARQLLLQHADLACLVGLWAYNPPALIRAAREAGRQNKVAIVGFDEDYQTLEGVKSGEVYATVVQNPFEFGYQSVKILAGLARGDESVLKSRTDLDAQGCIYIPHRVITRDNVGPFFDELKQLKGK